MEPLPYYYRKGRESERLISLKKILIEKCEKCNGTGLRSKSQVTFTKGKSLLDVENELIEKRVKCSCFKKYKKIEKFLISGIRREFWECETWDLYNSDRNVQNWKYIRTYIKNLPIARQKGIGFVFYGGNGTGKTSGGMLILLKALRLGFNVYYTYMRDLISEIRTLTLSDKAYNIPEVKGYIDEISEVDLLFIDEVGKTKISDFTEKEFEGFIRKRVANGLPTILATNLKKKKIFEIYGESLDDLLWGNMKELKFEGVSYRKVSKTKVVDELFKTKKGVRK